MNANQLKGFIPTNIRFKYSHLLLFLLKFISLLDSCSTKLPKNSWKKVRQSRQLWKLRLLAAASWSINQALMLGSSFSCPKVKSSTKMESPLKWATCALKSAGVGAEFHWKKPNFHRAFDSGLSTTMSSSYSKPMRCSHVCVTLKGSCIGDFKVATTTTEAGQLLKDSLRWHR